MRGGDRGFAAGAGVRPGVVFAAVAILALAGLALRAGLAWSARFITDPDCGIVALMARHIVERGERPVFFYGQAYMGSLEPAVSALLGRLFGVSGFTVNMGPALLGALTLPFLFLWAADAGGRRAGLVAMALCVIGPREFFLFQSAPRGGYMMTQLLSVVIPWMSCRMASSLAAGRDVAAWWFALLGLLAGLGWWSNPIITSALLASAAVLAVGLRGRVLRPGVAAGVAFFFAGSSPFWIWNARHGWESFSMAGSLGAISLDRGLKLLGERGLLVVGLDRYPPWAGVAVLGLYVVLAVAGLIAGLRRSRGIGPPGRRLHLLCVLLFVAVSLGLYTRSHFATMNTARYLLSLVPALALLAGVGAALLPGAVARGIALAAAGVLVASQLPVLADVRGHARGVARRFERANELGAALREQGVTGVLGHFRHYALNFNLGEEFCFTDLVGNYAPGVAACVETAERVAVLDNHGGISSFLRSCGGQCRRTRAGRFRLDHSFVPPFGGLSEIGTNRWREVTDGNGTDLGVVADRDADTWWTAPAQASPGCIEIRFRKPETVRCLRLIGVTSRSFPERARVEWRRPRQGAWEEAIAPHAVTEFFWSGPRPYWGGRRHRLEYRLPDVRIAALRVAAEPSDVAAKRWRVAEVQVFGPGPDLPSEPESLPALMDVLRGRGIRRLYADRWVSNRIRQTPGSGVDVEVEPKYFAGGLSTDGLLRLTPETGLLAPAHDADSTREVLRRHGIAMRRTSMGPWVLFDRPARRDGQDVARLLPLYWTGFGCLRGYTKRYAYEQSDGRGPETSPQIAAEARFAGGVDLVGITVPRRLVRAGEAVEVSYFWRAPPKRPMRPLVFVHFSSDRFRFQDDHVLLESTLDRDLAFQPTPEVFVERRVLRVPADAPPGEYRLQLGQYDGVTFKRFGVRSGLPTRDRAVELPVRVSVAAAGVP